MYAWPEGFYVPRNGCVSSHQRAVRERQWCQSIYWIGVWPRPPPLMLRRGEWRVLVPTVRVMSTPVAIVLSTTRVRRIGFAGFGVLVFGESQIRPLHTYNSCSLSAKDKEGREKRKETSLVIGHWQTFWVLIIRIGTVRKQENFHPPASPGLHIYRPPHRAPPRLLIGTSTDYVRRHSQRTSQNTFRVHMSNEFFVRVRARRGAVRIIPSRSHRRM